MVILQSLRAIFFSATALVFFSVPIASALTITTNPSDVTNRTYTHIIVGGGTAGLTVASRLAESPEFTILVIEAGPDEQDNIVIDDPAQEITAVIDFSWFYSSIPQSVGGNVQTIEQGKVLGGSSAINGMQWTRAAQAQYDSFEELGNPGWNSDSLFSYMKKSEHFHFPNEEQLDRGATVEESVHGTSGPVNAGFPQPYNAFISYQSYISAILKVIPGLVKNQDLCSGTPNGAAVFGYSITPGTSEVPGGNKRSSSAAAYIYPFLQKGKPNLTILVGQQATSIIWGKEDGQGSLPRAVGVEFVPTPSPDSAIGSPSSVWATSEVIVSAGALGSPHFLELSGIGDKTILEQAGIPVKVNLPSVGTNLQDQPLTTSVYNFTAGLNGSVIDTTNQVTEGSVAYLELNQVLGTKNGNAAGQYLLETVASRAQAIVDTGSFTSVPGLTKILRVQANSIVNQNVPVVEMSFGTNVTPGAFSHLIWNLLPQVRGTVHVASSNPSVPPVLNPMYLSNQFEIDLHGNATKTSRTIFNTQPLQSIWSGEVSPGASVPENASDQEWQDFVIGNYGPVLHPVGTVPMLPQVDGGAVDSNLIVYGTQNVRVVDSSIIPIQISAHLSATVYGIAEKAADIIKSCAQ